MLKIIYCKILNLCSPHALNFL